METTLLRTEQKRTRFLWPMFVLLVAFMLLNTASLLAQETTRYEAENTNLSNASVATTYSGYTGSGYVTGLTSEWSRLSFDKGVSANTTAQVTIRYANGTGSAVNNLALYIGSTKVQNLSFPATASWTTWSTLSVTFSLPAGYQSIALDGEVNVSTSVNVDYVDLTTGVTATPGSFSQTSPASGSTDVTTLPAFTWGESSGAVSYSLVVSTNSSLSSPVINQTGLTNTSFTPATALTTSTTYYWRVTAVNGSGSTVASNGGISFTTAAPLPAPGSFTQTTPANNATNVSTTPAFTWAASSNASSYTLVVSTNSSLTSPVISQSGITGTSHTSAISLGNNTVYYWRVTAINATGSTVASNSGISFTTTATLPAPGNFSQTQPTSGSTGVSVTPTFTWGASTNAASYSLVVSSNSSLTSPIINQTGITGTSFTAGSALANNATYYWRVTAANASGTTNATNSGISFTTEASAPSGNTTRYEAESTNYSNASVASSNSGFSGSGYVTGMNNEFSRISFDRSVNETTNSSIAIRYANGTGSAVNNLAFYVGSTKIQNLSFPTTANWNTWATLTIYFSLPAGYQNLVLKSEQAAGSSVNVDYLDLTTGIALPPVAFTQSAPANGATGVSTTPAFTWSASSNATSYTLVVSTNSSLATPVINQAGITSTTYTPGTALTGNTQYYWRVTAVNSAGSTQATNGGISFTTAVPLPAPGTFSQTAPASGATGVANTPAFSWASSSNAASYSLVVSTNSSLASPVINATGITTTSYTPASPLASSTTYYWKVTAVNATSTTDATNGGISFATQALPIPGTFSQTAPAANATGVSTRPAFSWASASNAASYTLTVSTSSSFTSPEINQTGITETTYTPTINLAYGTQYYWRVVATNASGTRTASNSGLSFTTAAAPPPTPSQPGLIRELWEGVTGSTVSSLTSYSGFPNSPTSSNIITTFDVPQDIGEQYGQRVRGYIKPLTTGSYQFWIASDDDSELWLSTDDQPANKVKIASVSGWTNYVQYNKYGSQQSASFTLTAGNYYYIEALHKEGTGGDHMTVAWQGPGISHQIITSAYVVTAPPAPLPLPGAFTQTTPANNATGVSLTPTFSWTASSDAASYTVTVSTSSSFANPVINQTGITSTSFTPGGGLNGTTTYYWRVTAVNETGTKVATNAGLAFTTLTPPAPGAFTQTAPANNATNISRTTNFTWAAASNASSYALIVSTSSSYTSPIINVTGLTSTSYSHSASLAGNTKYYWRVTATNSTGNTVATNAGISFTTSATTGTYYYVATTGVDAPDRGTDSNPFRTIAYAAKRVAANQNNTIFVRAGVYSETEAIVLPTGVNLEGAGESSVTITSPGPVPVAPTVDTSSGDFKLWWDGSLIQLVSASYGNDPLRKYGSPSEMTPAANGNQILSGFTIDGNSKQVKAGVWVQNRNNVTMHHVTIKNCNQRGAVFGRSDMWWYIPLPEGMWMNNTRIYNCTFTNNGAQLGSESTGNLCIAGLDGADIYNITINDNVGYGIKFIWVGHYRNVKIHDCNITVNENDAAWGEKISIELWNLSYGNEVYDVVCNTWHSYVNHGDLTTYEPTGTNTDNLKIYRVRMIDSDGSSSKEAIEAALSGVEIYECYIQDKGFGIAIWNGMGQTLKKNYIIRNNIITNVLRTPQFGFGKSSAVFVPDAAQNIKIYNNIFERMGNGLNLDGASGVDVKNNVFINTMGADVENGSSVTFRNNLKYHVEANKTNWVMTGGPTVGTGNVLGNPGFQNTGTRWDTYYKPASSSSFCVDKGLNVGLAYAGSAPDIGRWEFGLAQGRLAGAPATQQNLEDEVLAYPNPTKGVLKISAGGRKIYAAEVFNGVGTSTGVRELFDGQTEITLDITDLSPNFYLVKIKHSDGLSIKKVVRIP